MGPWQVYKRSFLWGPSPLAPGEGLAGLTPFTGFTPATVSHWVSTVSLLPPTVALVFHALVNSLCVLGSALFCIDRVLLELPPGGF